MNNKIMTENKMQIYSFYRFKKISNKTELKRKLDKYLQKKNCKGTILIAKEGINGSVSGEVNDLNQLLMFIKIIFKIRKLSLKKNPTTYLPFNKMKVRLKKEIVSLGFPNLNVIKSNSEYIHPKDWDKFTNQKKIKLIDTRNVYEIPIGKFENAINPLTSSFREFPKKFHDLKIDKNQEIALYCTGGIRCEKASTYLKIKGFRKVYQLKGGILNYLDYYKKRSKINKWRGECFVFDKRVSVNKNLEEGSFLQCYGCRRPLSQEDLKSKYYLRGVYCPYCCEERTDDQKKRSKDRQEQIDLFKYSYCNK